MGMFVSSRAKNPYDVIDISGALARYPGLSVKPSPGTWISLVGDLAFSIVGPRGHLVNDCYRVVIHIPMNFPRVLATVFEIGGRISDRFHKLSDRSLCMGSPTALRLTLLDNPTALGLIELVVLPYLYGHSCCEETGEMPFGELEHGIEGIQRHFASLFGVSNPAVAPALAMVAGLRRRVANKKTCPCGSGSRFGQCHHLAGNRLRRALGRGWLRQAQAQMTLDSHTPRTTGD